VDGGRGSTVREAFREGWPEVCGVVSSRLRREAEAFLQCGQLRYGFVEVSCEACHEARLVAFSCKGRGWCPSCTNRRAVETGAALEATLPFVRHRQWTLSIPFSLRFTVVKQPALLQTLASLLVRAVWRRHRQAARRLGASDVPFGGAVVFTQWFGSTLQLTPHLHVLVPDALWRGDGEALPVPPPTDDEVTTVLARVLRQARRRLGEVAPAFVEDDADALRLAALQHPLPMEVPVSSRCLVATGMGFSLHAGTAVHGNDREGLERLCRYGARGPVADCRLRRLEDGRYEYTPKRGSPFTLTAAGLVKRLVALTPPPNAHLTTFHGVFAPNARLRPLVTRQPEEAPPPPAMSELLASPPKKKRRLDWATLHQRTFGTDVLRCPCGGRRRIHAVHSTRAAAEARLAELGVSLPPASRRLPPATAQPGLPFAA
jgi:hypothetical protein